MSRKTVFPPADGRPPNIVGCTITCRVNPALIIDGPLSDADFIVPPGSMVFASAVEKPHSVKRRKTTDDVLDVVANGYNIQSRSLKHPLRFVGVAVEGEYNKSPNRR